VIPKNDRSQPHDPLEELISEQEILSEIKHIARRLDSDYFGKELVIVMVMKGALCLVSDLIRNLHIPCAIEFIQASSYGMQGTKPGELFIYGIERLNLKGKHVLIVDDIFDTGKTLSGIVDEFEKMPLASLRTLVLLTKKVSRRTSFKPDISLFDIEDRFVVGYGLDYKEHYRGLKGIYILKNPEEA
jgi:hypoxanthine phosphoribosyltransferase